MPIVSLINENGKVERTFDVISEKIIFEALDDLGHQLPHGCLAGSCSACRIEVLSGAQNLSPPGAIEQNTIESYLKKHPEHKGKSIRLSCRCKVTGDVGIRPLD